MKRKKAKILKIPNFCSIHSRIATQYLLAYSNGSKSRNLKKTLKKPKNSGFLGSGARPRARP